MATPSEIELYNALLLKMQTNVTTVNSGTFTANGSPGFEVSASAFPNGRSEKFIDFDGSSDYYVFDPTSVSSFSSGIVSFWIKPDFSQAGATARYVFSSYDTATTDGLIVGFAPAQDDWTLDLYIDGSHTNMQVYTTGQTWSADDVIHMVVMYKKDATLDGSKSGVIYINNVLTASFTGTWNDTGDNWSTTSKIGSYHNVTNLWDGGIFDWALLGYDTLAASYTDAEIVDALYSNALGAGSSHKFVCELGATGTTPGLSIVARKTRLRTGSTPVTRLEIDGSGNVEFNKAAADADFTMYKKTTGSAYVYDAGTDTHKLSGAVIINDNAVVDGTADEIQLKVQAHSTQNANILEVEDSGSNNLVTIDPSGNLYSAASMQATAGFDCGDAGGFSGMKFNAGTTQLEVWIDGSKIGHFSTDGTYTDDVA